MPHIEELSTQWRGSRVSVCQWPPAWLAHSTSKTVEPDPLDEPVDDVETPARVLVEAPGEVLVEAPVEAPEPDLESFEVETSPVPSGPPSYPWRQVLAEWPVEWRQAWGELAADYDDAGLDWMSSEIAAFEDVSARKAKAEAPPQRRLAS